MLKQHQDNFQTVSKQHLILDDDAVGFRWLFPVKENSVLKRGGSQ